MNRKDKVVNITFKADMEIDQIQQAITGIKQEFGKVSFPENTSKRLLKDLQDLEEELQTLRATSSKIETFGDLEDSEKSLNKAKKLLNDLVTSLTSIDQAGDFEKLIPKDFVDKIKAANKAYSDFNKETKNSLTNLNNTKKGLKELINAHEELAKIQGPNGSKEKAQNKVNSTTQEYLKEKKELDELVAEQGKLNKKRTRQANKNISQSEIDEAKRQYDEVTKAVSEQQLKVKNLKSTLDGYDKTLKKIITAEAAYALHIEANGSAYKEYGETIEDLKRSLEALSDKGVSPEQIKKLSNTLKAIDEDSFKDLKDDLSNIEELLGNMSVSAAEKVGEAIKNVTSNLDKAEKEADGLSKELGGSKGAAEAAQKLKDEIGAVKNQMLDFFSISNAIRIFEKAVDRAFQSVKELDAAMTETAVVTDFSVGDMWEALPEYASIARELGTTTLDVYEATTLLYQQGLQTNEVMEAGTEILKFARIAGLDAADATNFMTAAIRGFNMEMNEVNTKRVNDVYSELAAITASDTEQISVAVSKTASLAKNAGMELETTAAMLAQVIETTQEAPETAGTALKTIIARFQELKKDPLEMEEIDGEVVDANKIEAALRSVGVALRDTTGQFRDLDDVFLELSSKWNTLDKNQQRYIATVAAGSRQQSRFIAMMSDYERTMELVDAANNSAGSSQEQFDKTLESLDSKLKRLSDAWQLFTMGIMNSDFIKAGVDILTNILTAVNDLTGSFGNLGTLVSRVGLIIGALVIGKKAITALSKSLDGPTGLIGMITKAMETAKTAVSKTGKQAGEEFSSRATSSIKSNVTEFYEAGKAAGEAAKQGVESAYNAGLSQAVPTTIQNKESKAKVEIPEKFELNQKQKETLDLKTKVELEGLSEEDLKKERKRIKKLKTKYENNSRDFRNNSHLTDNQRNQVDLFYGSQLGLQEIDAEIERRKNPAPQTPQVDVPDVQTKPQTQPKQEQPDAETPETKPQKVDPDVALSYEKTSKAIYGTAAAASVLGMGLSAVAVGFENSGNEKAAQSFDAIASSVSGLGAVLGLLPTILSAMGTGAMAAMPWIAGIAAGIAAIVAVVKIIDIIDETEAEKLERLTTEAEESAAAYDNILKKSEELASNCQAYEDMQNDFENLTKGTKEWKDALAETNQQVLELISTYPELVSYLSRSSDGKLNIDTKGWKELEEIQAKAERYGYIAKSVDQIEAAEQQLKISREVFGQMSEEDKAIMEHGGVLQSVQIVEKANKRSQAMRDARAGDFDGKSFKEIKETLQSQYNILEEDLNSVATSIVDYLETVRENELLIESQYITMLNGALEYSDNSANKFADSAISLLSQKEKDETAILNELFDYEGIYKDKGPKELQEVLKSYGLTMEDVGEEVWNDISQLKDKIVDLEFGDQLIKELEKVLAVSEEWSTDNEKIEGTNISKSDFIDAYNNFNIGQANVEDYAILEEILALDEAALNSIEGIDTILVEDAEIVAEKVKEQKADENRKRQSTFYEAEENSDSKTIRRRNYTNEKMKELSADQYESYLGMLRNVIANSETNKDEIGEAVANFFEESIIGVVDDMDLSSIMDNLSSFDFNTEQGLLDFENYLRDLGYAVPADQIDGLIEKLKELGGAANNISFDQAIEKGKVLRDAKETLESDGDLTEEQMNALIETGKFERDNFIRTLDGYKLTGMDIETAIYAIGEEIVNALTQGAENDQKKEDLGENFRNRVENSDLSDSEKNRLLTGTATEDEVLAFYGGSSNIPSYARDSLMAQYERESGAVGFKADPNADLTGASTAFQLETQNLTPNELLNFDLTSFKEQYDIIGRAADLINKDYADALINAANESDDFKVALKAQIKMLEENEDAFDDNQKRILQMAKNYLEVQDNIESFGKTISENITALLDATPEEYAKNIAAIAEQATAFFGQDITSEFVEQNLAAFQQLAQGGETARQAYINLEKEILKIRLASEIAADSTGNLEKAIDSLDGTSITIDGWFNNQQIISELLKTYGTMEKVKEALESMGYETSYEPVTKWVNMSVGSFMSSMGGPASAMGFLGVSNLADLEKNLTKTISVPVTQLAFKWRNVKGSYTPSTPETPGSKGGGDSTPSISKPSEVGENPYDKLFNLTRQLNEELRKRNELERQFSEMEDGVYYKYNSETGTFDKMTASAKERLTLLNEQERSLERQAALYGEIAKTAKESAENLYNENLDLLENYLTKGEDGSFTVNIDAFKTWEKDLKETFNNLEAERIRLENLGDKAKETEITAHNTAVEEYEKEQEELNSIRDIIEKILSYLDESYDAEDNQAQLAAQYEALQEQNRQDAIDFLNRVMDAVIADRQKEIDELSNINDSINDTNSRILEGIQDQIDLQRRQRDNQKKENEIEEKQRRLDYLRQDTSNANDLAIKQLEKEIAEQQEDYTDTLIDQKISDLQDQNDAAAEQRERQIELMQSQLDWQVKNGEFWGEVSRLIEEGFDENGNIIKDSELWKLMSAHEGYMSMSSIEKEFWIQELKTLKNKFDNYVNQLQDPDNDNEIEGRPTPEGEFEFRDTKGQIKRGKKDEDGSVRLTEGDYTTEYSDFTWDPATGFQAGAERTRFNATEGNWAKDEDGNWIINDNEGNALKDQWISYKDNEYYMDKEGKLATGWKKLDDKWYYFDPTEGATQGALKTGWLKQNGVWYYLDTEGANRGEMYTGEREIDGEIHVFAENGAWLYEKKGEGGNGEEPKDPENPEDPETGEPKDNTATKEGWYEEDGKWYYGKDGKKLSGWQRLGTPWFYFDPSNGNAMVTGEHEIDGVKYYFDENGYWLEDGQQPGTGDPAVDGSTLKVKAGELFDRDPNYYVRKSKSETAAELYNTRNIPDNEEIEILEKSGNWYKISSSLGTGWFSAAELKGIKSAYHERMKAFKTGGLADFTGPAWLDGTKSRPELVLNQEDTQNFIKLKDVLSSFMDNVRVSGGSSNKSSGDNYFDIDIAVDEIASDYDVDQLAERIKKTIYEDSLYRNVNMLSFHR